MKVLLKTKRVWVQKGERVRFCGLAYLAIEAEPAVVPGGSPTAYYTVCKVVPADAGKRGPLMHEAELVSESPDTGGA